MKIIKILTASISIFLFSFLVEAEELETAWESEKVFELPESVIYDKTNDVLYVALVSLFVVVILTESSTLTHLLPS